MSINLDEITAVYLKMRDKKAALEKEIKDIDDQQTKIEQYLVQYLKGTSSLGTRTAHATVAYQKRSRYFSNDWPAMRQWTKLHDAVDLFEARLHQGNTEAWMETNKEAMLEDPSLVPPGLQTDVKETVLIKRIAN